MLSLHRILRNMQLLHKQKKQRFLKMYTKQHFNDLAQYFKTTKANSKEDIINELMQRFALDNPKFKTEKFLKACGVA